MIVIDWQGDQNEHIVRYVYILDNKLGWYEGNVVKYITRHKMKNGKEDLLKAIKYIELLIEEDYES